MSDPSDAPAPSMSDASSASRPLLVIKARPERTRALAGIVIAVVLVTAAYQGATPGSGQGMAILLLICAASVAYGSVNRLRRVPLLQLTPETLSFTGLPLGFTCRPENIERLVHDGVFLRLTFRDPAAVSTLQPSRVSPEKATAYWTTTMAAKGDHVLISGFTLQQAEELRHHLGLAYMPLSQTGQTLAGFVSALNRLTPQVWVTPTLIGLNILVYLGMLAAGVDPLTPSMNDMLHLGSNFPPRTMGGEPWRLVSCLFLHWGALHLAFNLWALWQLGRLVERLMGNVGLLLIYMTSGIAASLSTVAWNQDTISAGASGAVFGVAGAILGFSLRRGRDIPTGILRELRGGMLTFIGYNVVLGMTIEGIDQAAHLGGLVAGLFGGLILSQQLQDATHADRVVRNLILSISAAVVLLFIYAWLPGPSEMSGFISSIQRFATIEARVIADVDRAAADHDAGRIDDADFARFFRNDVLPAWQQGEQVLAAIKPANPAQASRRDQLAMCARMRREGWTLLIEGIEQQDVAKVNAAAQKQREANELAIKLSQGA